ncbi:MAG TPA: DUF488 family protein [Myxococcales bacterium]|nr:DUF488 family protein [Myxococcales bacterium]
MPLRTRRWNDPPQAGDGLRLLICRYRPRGLPKGEETWDEWRKQLGPSEELLAAFHGKRGPPISWDVYRKRYLAEMAQRRDAIAELAARVGRGETITLLCSSACTDPDRCHRTLLRALIEQQTARQPARRKPFIERQRSASRKRRTRVP